MKNTSIFTMLLTLAITVLFVSCGGPTVDTFDDDLDIGRKVYEITTYKGEPFSGTSKIELNKEENSFYYSDTSVLFSGMVKEDTTGYFAEEFTCINGKIEGQYKKWIEGRIIDDFNYENGRRLFGLSKEWYDNGNQKSETYYVDDEKYGLCKNWYENGNQESETNYVDGKKKGKITTWTPEGEVNKDGNYNGVDDDASVFVGFSGYSRGYVITDDGTCSIISHYKNGKQTYSAMLLSNGKLNYEINYVDGVKANSTMFWRDGKIRAKVNYNKNGDFHGLWQEWDEYGRLSRLYFKDGVRLK